MTTVNTRFLTTGIGSLPHHNVDAALEYAFRHDLPFLPQIPIRNPWEFMVSQGLEGLPGIQTSHDGTVTLNSIIWKQHSPTLQRRLDQAFRENRFEAFEPTSATLSCWQPFLWELQERKFHQAKIQIVGPLTAASAIRVHPQPSTSSASIDKTPLDWPITQQIYQLLLARATAMVRSLTALRIQPILFIDEPALFSAIEESSSRLEHLSHFIQSLKREGTEVGIHCCSDGEWNKLFSLPIDWLSFDFSLSRDSFSKVGPAIEDLVTQGGQLALGVIPALNAPQEDTPVITESIHKLPLGPVTLLTPSCGLAYHSIAQAEEVSLGLNRIKNRLLG